MRLRARIDDVASVRRLDIILTAASKMSKECVLRFTQDKVYIISADSNSVLGGPVAWGEFEKDKLFCEYNMEGVCENSNEIYLEFSPDTLHKSLTSLKSGNVQGLKLKLTKRNDIPNLTFEVLLGGAISSWVLHDLPVTVIARKYWNDYKSPTLPPVNVSLVIHEIKRFRIILDKYKSIGSLLTITGYKEGTLNLSIQTDEVKVSGHFNNLKAPVLKPGSEPWDVDLQDSASVKVDIKRLNQFFSAEMLSPQKVILNLVDYDLVHILMVTQDITYHMFIPRSGKS